MIAALTVTAIAATGGLGAALRYLIDAQVTSHLGSRFPWGLLVVNLSGSFALGLLTGLALDHRWTAVVSIGFLGGYTTFSAASLDTVSLLRERRYAAALLNGPGMLVACTALALAGIVLTQT